jgi:hypothetical protein
MQLWDQEEGILFDALDDPLWRLRLSPGSAKNPCHPS